MNLVIQPLPTDAELVSVRQVAFSAKATKLLQSLSACWDPGAQHWTLRLEELPKFLSEIPGASVALHPTVRQQLSSMRTRRPEYSKLDYSFRSDAIKPYAHQVEGFVRARDVEFYAFLMEMGTGKTRLAVDVLSDKLARGLIDRVLIVAGKSLVYNWPNEWDMFSPLPPSKRRAVVMSGTTGEKAAAIAGASEAQILVTNYHTVLFSFEAIMDWVSQGKTACLVDEATAIKTHSAKISKAVRKVGQQSLYRYILTGSPITQGPLDAFGMFEFLKPGLLGHSTFTSFKAEYAIEVRLRGIPVPVVRGYRNLSRLNKLIAPHSFRVLKSECLDLPAKVYTVREVDMTSEQARVYKSMRDEAVVELQSGTVSAPIVLTRLLRLQQITAGFLPTQDEFGAPGPEADLGSPKVEAALEILREALTSQQKVIVWCRFIWELKRLETALKEESIEHVLYWGETSAEDRQAAVDAIQKGTAKVFVGQIQTGGMGITLTACSTVIYLSNTFSLAERLQSEDRAHRIGQTKNVQYIDILCRKTIDRDVLQAHRDKKDVADVITGDGLRRLLGER